MEHANVCQLLASVCCQVIPEAEGKLRELDVHEIQRAASGISKNPVFETPLGGFVTYVLSEVGSGLGFHHVFIY